jgi:hypothetical protein
MGLSGPAAADARDTRDPRAVHAPAAYRALCRLEADIRAAVPADLLAVARRRVAMSLGQPE